jgi:hypothetical protein
MLPSEMVDLMVQPRAGVAFAGVALDVLASHSHAFRQKDCPDSVLDEANGLASNWFAPRIKTVHDHQEIRVDLNAGRIIPIFQADLDTHKSGIHFSFSAIRHVWRTFT